MREPLRRGDDVAARLVAGRRAVFFTVFLTAFLTALVAGARFAAFVARRFATRAFFATGRALRAAVFLTARAFLATGRALRATDFFAAARLRVAVFVAIVALYPGMALLKRFARRTATRVASRQTMRAPRDNRARTPRPSATGSDGSRSPRCRERAARVGRNRETQPRSGRRARSDRRHRNPSSGTSRCSSASRGS